jgi:hypothetical protein
MLSSTLQAIVDCQYGYNIKVVCIRQILKKKSEEEGTLIHLSEDFKMWMTQDRNIVKHFL